MQITQRIRSSSIFLRRIVGAMFMRLNSKCAHQLRPPLGGIPSSGAPPLAERWATVCPLR
jgi:hypothetical protein